jgi:predicted ATPase/DNA-binding SARP family transcriptional activator
MDVRVAGRPLPRLHSRKGQWLLALLALRHGDEVLRDWLAGVLWPETPQRQALFYLRKSLAELRRALGGEGQRLQSPTARSLRLDLAGAWTDLLQFDAAIAHAARGHPRGEPEPLRRAVALYRGPLLEGCAEEWVHAEREAREQACLRARESLAAEASARGDHAAAVAQLRAVVRVEPLRESAHRALMQALASLGDLAAVTHAYRDLRLLLHRELSAAPSPETTALYEQIQAEAKEWANGRMGEWESRSCGLHLSHSPIHPFAHSPTPARRLPVPLSELVGREQEVEDVAGWLGRERLVTLTGAGGVGKTRLSIAAAEAALAHFPEGAWFVDLAPLSDAAAVPLAVARSLGLMEGAGDGWEETLEEALAARTLLLVLDNCEHLLEAAAGIAHRLLSAGPGLRVLATSRQPLGLSGERIFRVPSLALPPPEPLDAEKEVASLLEYGAVRLFVDRAVQGSPAFRLHRRNAAAVVELCRRLDGIPLALEMAAARVRSLSAQEIRDRLDDRFRLLAGGSRAAPTRQKTLQAAIAWSWDLLSPAEQTLLARLSTFSGGWSLEAAEAICGEDDGRQTEDGGGGAARAIGRPPSTVLRPDDVLDLLTSLVDKSLVVAGAPEPAAGTTHPSSLTNHPTRYRFLETIGEYARQRLHEAGEFPLLCRRHRDYFVQWAEAMNARAQGPENLDVLARVAADYDNLRAALEWSLSRDEGGRMRDESGLRSDIHPSSLIPHPSEIPLRLAGALWSYWEAQGLFQEARRYLPQALALAPPFAATAARARALQGMGVLSIERNHDEAAAQFAESVAIWEKLGDRQGVIRALTASLALHHTRLDYAAAERALLRIRTIHEARGDRHGVAAALAELGRAAHDRGDLALARDYHQQSIALCRALGDDHRLARSLEVLAELEEACRAYSRGRAIYAEAMELFQRAGDKKSYVFTLKSLGHLVFAEGCVAEARAIYERVVALDREWGFGSDLCFAMIWVARAARSEGDHAGAQAVAAETLSLARRMGRRRHAAQAEVELAQIATELGDLGAARAHCEAALRDWLAVGNPWGIAEALECHAALALAQAQPARAARLLGATAALRESRRFPLRPWEQLEQDRARAAARAALGEEAFAAAWTEGRALSMEQAVVAALEEADG